jgi:hypothetical protein
MSAQKIDRCRATCDGCGHEGVLVVETDDFRGVRHYYEGFESLQAATIGGRPTPDPKASLPCPTCGGTSVTLSSLFEDC